MKTVISTIRQVAEQLVVRVRYSSEEAEKKDSLGKIAPRNFLEEQDIVMSPSSSVNAVLLAVAKARKDFTEIMPERDKISALVGVDLVLPEVKDTKEKPEVKPV